MTAERAYKAFKNRLKTEAVIKNRRFKKRILNLRRSKPNPRYGGLFVSPNGSPDNTGITYDQPIDVETYLDLELEDNDKVFFEAGHVYNVGGKEITATNVRYGRFGTGDDPIQEGTEDISGLTWTSAGSDVYTTPMAEEPSWIWINGVCAQMAETARIPITARGSTTTLTVAHSAVSGFSSIVDSYLVAKDKNFALSYRRKVTAYNGAGVITVDGPINTGSNVDLVLLNKTQYFNGNNQWAWAAGTLYVRAAASPSTLDIKASAHDFGIKTTGVLTVENIKFREYYTAAIWSTSTELAAPKLTVENCTFEDIRDVAVLNEREGTGTSVSHNTFTRIGNNGMHVGPCTNSFFNDNEFTDIGMQANYGWQTWSAGDGITAVVGCAIAYVRDRYAGNTLSTELDGVNCQFNDNVIQNVAYCGINLGLGTDNFIQRNVVSDFLNRFHDGGGIYTFHYRPTNLLNENNEISYNIVHNDNSTGGNGSTGIYMDNRTFAANIHHNTVFDCEWGVMLNMDTAGHTVEYNTVVDCDFGFVYRQADNGSLLLTENIGNTFRYNTAVAYSSAQRCVYFYIVGSYPDWNPFEDGVSDFNKYVSSVSAIADSDNEGDNLTLAQLRTAYGGDANSEFRLSASRLFEYNATSSPVTDNAGEGFETFDGVETDEYTIPAFSSIVLFPIPGVGFNTQSLQFVSSSSQYVNFGTNADIQFTQSALFTFSLRFKITAPPSGVTTLFDNRNGSGRGIAIQILATGGVQVQMVNTVTTNRLVVLSNVNYCDGLWHTLQVSKTGAAVTTVVIKVDNSELTLETATNLNATILSAGNLLLGSNSINSVFLNGFVCQLAYWNSNQNPNSALIFNGGVTHDLMLLAAPPLHYWPLNGDLLDYGSSANDLNGTGVNSPAFSVDVP